MLRTDFNEGQPMSASDWNAIATAVNRLWKSRAQFPLRLIKGDNWCLSVDPAYLPSINGAPPRAEDLVFIEVPACVDGDDSSVWIPAIIAA